MPKTAIDHIAAVPWAIEPKWLQIIHDIASRNLSDMNAVEKVRADRLAKSEKAGVRDGVAIIDIAGPIFRHANLMSDISGATTIENLAHDLEVALENPIVKAVLLNVDSPGGMVSGTNEFAAMIKAADKPITAYVGNQAASAAYWIVSAADEIVIDATGQLGSIGVVQTWTDDSKQKAERGIEDVEFVSSQSPNKRLDMQSDEGRSRIQQHVDDLADVFIGTVATNRGVTPAQVISDFGAGGTLIGEKAIAAGMADRLGSFEEVLAGLAGDKRDGIRSGSVTNSMVNKENFSMAGQENKTDTQENQQAPAITVATIAGSHPEIAAHFMAEGATAERGRILAIEGAALPGHDGLVAQLKADGKTSAGDAALQIMAAEKAKLGGRLDAQKVAGKLTDGVTSETTTTGENNPGVSVSASIEDRAKAKWDGDTALRSEFKSFSTYLAFAKAEDNGQVKIKKS